MNPAWQHYLSDFDANFTLNQGFIFNGQNSDKQSNCIIPVSQLSVLKVSGSDASSFLQGQSTCNLYELNDQNSSFGAFCNVKGRVISSFIILKSSQDWLLVLPTDLLTIVQKRLQHYILRAKVQLTDCSDDYCILGLSHIDPATHPFPLPEKHLATLLHPFIRVRLGVDEARYLLIADVATTQQNWSTLIQQGFIPQSSTEWDLLDLEAGIPWLCAETSEAFIPQMLNLDQLGGISFNKGCYTGQEIVARTHYLGKAKRTMVTAIATLERAPALNSNVINSITKESVGTVVATHFKNYTCTMLIVLATDAQQQTTLTLQDQPTIQLKLV